MSQQRYKYKDIQLPQLRSFCRVAAEGNFTTAAEGLHLSVPAVWQQVRALERELGATLLRRQGRKVELTPQGRLLLELAQPHVSGLDSLARLFEAKQEELQEQLTVAATPRLLFHEMPTLVQKFTHLHASIRLNLRAGRWYEVLDQVERGEADLGLAPWDREEPLRASLEYERLFDMPFLLLTGADHPLAGKKRLRPRDLVDYPFIVEPKETCDYRALVRWLQQDTITPERLRVVMVSNTVDTTCKYVALGVGIALAHVDPKHYASISNLRFRMVDPRMERLPVALLVRKGSHLSAAAEEFRKAVRRFLAA